MRSFVFAGLALFSALGAAKTPLAEYRELCNDGKSQGTTEFSNGIKAWYVCDVLAPAGMTGPAQDAGSAEDCAALCQAGCSRALWRYSTQKCQLFGDGEGLPGATSKGTLYLVPETSMTPEDNGRTEEDWKSEGLAYKDDLETCLSDKSNIQTQLDQCQQEQCLVSEKKPAPDPEPTKELCEDGYKDNKQIVVGGKRYNIFCEKFENIGTNDDVSKKGLSLRQCIEHCNTNSKCVHVVINKDWKAGTCHLRYTKPTPGKTPPKNVAYHSAQLVV